MGGSSRPAEAGYTVYRVDLLIGPSRRTSHSAAVASAREPAKASTPPPSRPAWLAHRLLLQTGCGRATPGTAGCALVLALAVHRAGLGGVRGLEELAAGQRSRAGGGLLVAGPGGGFAGAATAADPLSSSSFAGRVAAGVLAGGGGAEDALAGLGVLALFLHALFRGAGFAAPRRLSNSPITSSSLGRRTYRASWRRFAR